MQMLTKKTGHKNIMAKRNHQRTGVRVGGINHRILLLYVFLVGLILFNRVDSGHFYSTLNHPPFIREPFTTPKPAQTPQQRSPLGGWAPGPVDGVRVPLQGQPVGGAGGEGCLGTVHGVAQARGRGGFTNSNLKKL